MFGLDAFGGAVGEDRLGSRVWVAHKARARHCKKRVWLLGLYQGYRRIDIDVFALGASSHLQHGGARRARPTSATTRSIFVSGLR